MIEFDADTRRNIVEVRVEQDDSSYRAVVGGDSLEEALDGLMDGYFLNDWLRETMKGKLESYFDRTPSMTDEELQRFISILEDML